jgi:hypothetical protein
MTAVFSWKSKAQTISWPHAALWGLSVHWARRWFPNVVFYGDESAHRLFVDGLQLPFERVHLLPEIPDDLAHIYNLPKLNALRAAVNEYGPTLHLDHDCHFRRAPSAAILAAPFAAEYRYTESDQPVLFRQVREFNATLPEPLPEPRLALACGIMGGSDAEGIAEFCTASIGSATSPKNREAFAAQEPGAGYWKGVMIEEMACGSRWPDAVTILATGGGAEDDRRRIGYHHLAGGKKDSGMLAVMDNLFRDDFSEDRARLFHRWNNALE